MDKLHGRFYYRLTANGNLIGEFSNNHSTRSQPESAERISESSDNIVAPLNFVGKYHSTWFEPAADVPIPARLEISQKQGTHLIFTIRWLSKSGKLQFEGEAMTGEGLLIGNYWGV